ncbi:hypothetical protein GCM10018793_27420 [Streptomyces sulfonofaciens]|uniref:Uncharacterized protein n=1 Tax=Streptomyces sulfonofaciens TaxID=68272 RepID=A0A919G5E0_9ACTN|nr:hypothetical protein GCM10018793_27420 [Streptomyces sulfonofaciens]
MSGRAGRMAAGGTGRWAPGGRTALYVRPAVRLCRVVRGLRFPEYGEPYEAADARNDTGPLERPPRDGGGAGR